MFLRLGLLILKTNTKALRAGVLTTKGYYGIKEAVVS